ncbi:hypothetical protein PEDI_22130 [Persicobacter diffluens]|uniref:Uncharacterized protein n=2 Tax=Persicobacter diffluens TaxID=981 RepID=A0AAN5ALQ3_9BACT|nr:hypothetical protein PEDI_22130 [Persicobacter diffluens]
MVGQNKQNMEEQNLMDLDFMKQEVIYVLEEEHDQEAIEALANNLLELEEEEIQELPGSSLPVEGKTDAPVLVMVNYPDYQFPEADKTLLANILSAKNIAINEVAILNIAQVQAINLAMVRAEIPAKFILTFGLTEADVPELRGLQWNVARKGKMLTVCPTNSLSLMHQDREAKMALWNMIKGLPVE